MDLSPHVPAFHPAHASGCVNLAEKLSAQTNGEGNGMREVQRSLGRVSARLGGRRFAAGSGNVMTVGP